MYTQCPHCDTAFKVTAPDLQRDFGRMRCRACDRDFNALERLTEDPPGPVAEADETRSIIESLEELTGSHAIRIEDTGVEWRVFEDDDAGDATEREDGVEWRDGARAVPPPAESPAADDTGSVRWYIEDFQDEMAVPADDTEPDPSDDSLEDPLDDYSPAHRQERLPLSSIATSDNHDDVQRYDDNTLLPDDFLDDHAGDAEPPVPQRRAEDHLEPRSPEADEAQVDLALGEPGDWMDLLDEVGKTRLDGQAATGGGDEDPPADTDIRLVAEDEEPRADLPSDIDTQFDLQAIEMGIDLTGNREPGPPTDADFQEAPEPDVAAPADAETDRPGHEEAPGDDRGDEWPGAGEQAARVAEEEDAEDRRREREFEQELAAAFSVTAGEEPGLPADGSAEPPVPPPTEEEMTINRLIDQDLLRLAAQQNVFTSKTGHRLEDSPHVETIIMEGEMVRTVADADRFTGKHVDAGTAYSPMDDASADRLQDEKDDGADDGEEILGTYVANNARRRGGRRRTDPPRYRVIAGVAVLALALTAQVVHAYRESLATYPVFDRTVGSVYRLFGKPVVPGWDIRDWQFESTSGSTDAEERFLTINSRLVNNSGRSLPYPLLHVSLTDRWEEIIGSTVLEPSEYLADASPPAGRVSPGEHFTAVVTIESPSPDATGFKLNVCYPEAGGRVRCATEDFK